MSPELVLLLRLALLIALVLGLELLLERRTRRRRQQLPAKWQRALNRTYGNHKRERKANHVR